MWTLTSQCGPPDNTRHDPCRWPRQGGEIGAWRGAGLTCRAVNIQMWSNLYREREREREEEGGERGRERETGYLELVKDVGYRFSATMFYNVHVEHTCTCIYVSTQVYTCTCRCTSVKRKLPYWPSKLSSDSLRPGTHLYDVIMMSVHIINKAHGNKPWRQTIHIAPTIFLWKNIYRERSWGKLTHAQ